VSAGAHCLAALCGQQEGTLVRPTPVLHTIHERTSHSGVTMSERGGCHENFSDLVEEMSG
jgi:hypothetical protein